jgi:hypothetical protein
MCFVIQLMRCRARCNPCTSSSASSLMQQMLPRRRARFDLPSHRSNADAFGSCDNPPDQGRGPSFSLSSHLYPIRETFSFRSPKEGREARNRGGL